MSECMEKAKEELLEAGLRPEVLEVMINLSVRPDETQKLSEEIFRLREENTKLLYQCEDLKSVTLEFAKEIGVFLKNISEIDIKEEASLKKFNEIQRKSNELHKVFNFIEMIRG